jgi:hypothetical protein
MLFVVIIQDRPDIGCLNLGSHLLGPVQRIPRYKLLLQGLRCVNVKRDA